jgi:iron complex outermembrane receptor protein
MQQGALNTNRIAFAALVLELSMVPKIKAYYEGIPLTTAEGSSTIEDIDMETIGS